MAYRERWSKPPTGGGALDKGTLWHSVLQAHYQVLKSHQGKDGLYSKSPEELLNLCAAAVGPLLYDPTTGGYRNETSELIEWMYIGYVATHGIDPDWLLLAVEHNMVVPLLDNGRRTRFRLKCKIDLIVRDLSLGNHLWVVDHKSGKDLPSQKALELDDQFGFYTLALQRVGKPIFGQVYNASRTQRNKTGGQTLESRNARYRLYRNEPELLAIEADALKAMRAAWGPGTNTGVDPYASPNTDMCKWKCDFLEAHLMARKGHDLRTMVKEFGFEQNFERH